MKNTNSNKKQSLHKTHLDNGLNYYKQTLLKKDIATPVISLVEFINKYKKINPHIKQLIYADSYLPDIKHNCNGNSLFLATVVMREEFDYIEGVLRVKNELYHHGWIYSRTLKCYVDPTLDPEKKAIYYISDKISGIKNLDRHVDHNEHFESYNPEWINRNVIPVARIIPKNNERKKDN